MAQGGGEMTKSEFLAWLDRYRYTGWVREVVQSQKFSEAELDGLHKAMQPHLEMKNEWRRKIGA
jgi:hypothetical protein